MKHSFEQSNLKIYNSLSGDKQPFEPINKGQIGMYVCGPTVYSNVHLGNCRTFISFDFIFRYFKALGYKVRYVRNITDVGHLVNDIDEGEDKIAEKARLEQLEPMEIVQKYTLDFHQVLDKFNNHPPSIEPTATGHIVEQIKMIKDIIAAGFAYEVNGSVYFDVIKYNNSYDYGILSKRKIDELFANTRELEAQSEKRNPQDFALWKKASDSHIMRWESPWGIGFPGWHLECSVMSSKYLGQSFDIHGGGMDLKFPHHECEIAQCQAANKVAPVNYWLHANMLTLNGKKMSKSTGNVLMPDELFSGNSEFLTQAFDPSVVRFFILQAHYRSILDFSNDALLAAEKGYNRLMQALDTLESIEPAHQSNWSVEEWSKKCYAALDDDFNSPILIAHLFDAVNQINKLKSEQITLSAEDLEGLKELIHLFAFDILGLLKPAAKKEQEEDTLDHVMQLLIDIRNGARADKNWAMADKIRDRLAEAGLTIKDGKDGTTFEKK